MNHSRHKPDSLFDSHVDSYDADCMRGLKLSGESREYFSLGRLEFLRNWWRASRRPEPTQIVDYGCGTGDVTALLADVFPDAMVVGLDPSAASIERAHSRHGSKRVVFRRLGEHTGIRRAQLVHVNGVMHHVAPPDRLPLLHDIRDRLEDSGVLALFENNPLNPGTRLVMARIPFDRDAVPVSLWEARRTIQEAGFNTAHQGYLFYFPRPLRLLRPLERWLVHLPLGAQYGLISVRA